MRVTFRTFVDGIEKIIEKSFPPYTRVFSKDLDGAIREAFRDDEYVLFVATERIDYDLGLLLSDLTTELHLELLVVFPSEFGKTDATIAALPTAPDVARSVEPTQEREPSAPFPVPAPNASSRAEDEDESDAPTCRICYGTHDEPDDRLFTPCKCKGSVAKVHEECLTAWRLSSANPKSYYRCEQCLYEYDVQRVTWAKYVTSVAFARAATIAAMAVGALSCGVLVVFGYAAVFSTPHQPRIEDYFSRIFPFLRETAAYGFFPRIAATGVVALGVLSFFATQVVKLVSLLRNDGRVGGGFFFMLSSGMSTQWRIFALVGLVMAYNDLYTFVTVKVRVLLSRLGERIVEVTRD